MEFEIGDFVEIVGTAEEEAVPWLQRNWGHVKQVDLSTSFRERPACRVAVYGKKVETHWYPFESLKKLYPGEVLRRLRDADLGPTKAIQELQEEIMRKDAMLQQRSIELRNLKIGIETAEKKIADLSAMVKADGGELESAIAELNHLKLKCAKLEGERDGVVEALRVVVGGEPVYQVSVGGGGPADKDNAD